MTQPPPARQPRPGNPARRRAGLSLVEMLISLAITAALLTAVTLALDASFTAYASAAQSTSAQSSTRMVVHRIQSMIRGGIAQGPLNPDDAAAFASLPLDEGGTLTLPAPTFGVRRIDSSWLVLDDRTGRNVILDYQEDEETLFLSTLNPAGTRYLRRPLLEGVTTCDFTLLHRSERQSDFSTMTVLMRGGIDLTVQPGADSTLGTEAGNAPPIRLVASTSPRRLR